MISAFVSRKPWATVVVSLFLSPAIGMLFLGKGLNSLTYFTVWVVLGLFPELLFPYQTIVFWLVGLIHCHFIASNLHGKRPRLWFARWYFLMAVASVLIFIRSFLWEPFSIPAGSMIPNLLVGDHLFVSKYAYGYSKYSFYPVDTPFISNRILYTQPERGDIAVFKLPSNPKNDYIKRIIGLPGDRVQVKNGILHINGSPVERLSVDHGRGISTYGEYDHGYIRYIETLPNGRQYYIQEESDIGPSDNTPVYEVPEGHFFALGDNRDNSSDSRFLDRVGYIPMENLVGRLAAIYWNSREKRLRFLD